MQSGCQTVWLPEVSRYECGLEAGPHTAIHYDLYWYWPSTNEVSCLDAVGSSWGAPDYAFGYNWNQLHSLSIFLHFLLFLGGAVRICRLLDHVGLFFFLFLTSELFFFIFVVFFCACSCRWSKHFLVCPWFPLLSFHIFKAFFRS